MCLSLSSSLCDSLSVRVYVRLSLAHIHAQTHTYTHILDLVKHYSGRLQARGVRVRTSTAVQSIEQFVSVCGHPSTQAVLGDGSRLPFGTMVWSAGLAPVKFVKDAILPKHERSGRLIVDEYLRVSGLKGRVFAFGDCARNETSPLLPLASVAEQQAQYLSDCFNEHYATFDLTTGETLPDPGPVAAPVGLPFPRFLYARCAEFKYRSVGAMVSMGLYGGVVDMSDADVVPRSTRPAIAGFFAMLAWYVYWSTYIYFYMYEYMFIYVSIISPV